MVKNTKFIVIVVILLLLVGGGAYIITRDKPKNTQTKGSDGSTINLEPATYQERKDAEDHKKDIEKQAQSQNNTASTTQANVTITYLTLENDGVAGAGIINNVFEDGGVCTLTLTKGGMNFTGTSAGLTDVNKTTCPSITIDKTKLSSGQWSAVLSYSSPKTNGTSQARSINIP